MDISMLRTRLVGQKALVAKTQAELAEAVKNKWPLAQKELTVRLNRQKAALASTEAVIAEVSAK